MNFYPSVSSFFDSEGDFEENDFDKYVDEVTELLNSNPWDYLTAEPTHLRIFKDDDEWFIDGADDQGRYTGVCWSYDTFDEAVANLSDFFAMNDTLTWSFRPGRRSRVRFNY